MIRPTTCHALPKRHDRCGPQTLRIQNQELRQPEAKLVAISASSSTSSLRPGPIQRIKNADRLNRRRRIKCSEERPSCARCVKSGWKCDSYGDTKPLTSMGPPAAKSLTGAAPNLFLSTPPPAVDDEDPAVGTVNEDFNRISKRQATMVSFQRNLPDCLLAERLLLSPKRQPRRTSAYYQRTGDVIAIQSLWARNRSSSSSSLANATLAISPAAYEVPFKTPGTPIKRQLLHYFYIQAVPDLSGYSSHNFWTNLIFTSYYAEPAVHDVSLGRTSQRLCGGRYHETRWRPYQFECIAAV